jgi:dTDP-4-amino-4,6-dideoxygalactose transaminase
VTGVPFLDLSRQVQSIRPALERAMSAVLDGGRFVAGTAVSGFERAFADYCGAAHAVGVGSGTDAITLALRALGIGPGDEVVTVANTCVPTLTGILAAGATPVLVDVDPRTYTLDPDLLGDVVTERTRAIVPVHLYGQCAEMDRIVAFARGHGLRVVEDAAHAHGAEFRGRRAGALADAAAFSFYPTKNLGALGDGGMVVTDDAELDATLRLLRNHGQDEAGHATVAGRNSRLDELQAAVLLVKLGHLDAWNERRRELASFYSDELRDGPVALQATAKGCVHAHHLFVVRATDRDAFRARLAAAGVGTLVHYPLALHRHPAHEGLATRAEMLHVSERLAGEVVSLPLYPELSDADAATVVAAVRTCAREPVAL